MENNNTYSTPADFTERFINQTNAHIFLTGKAGTGKTTLLRKIVESTHKNTVIVAPTGIAALNAGGVTIHSFFGLPFGGFIPEFIPDGFIAGASRIETKETLKRHFHFNSQRLKLFRKLELLIIDEVSMLRADLLDAIDWTLRNVRRNNEPFGGVQVLFIGDLLQLPPVIKPEEWHVLRNHYQGIFFFHAHVLRENGPLYIELDKIYRQDDYEFIQLLNHLRNNQLTPEDVTLLARYVQPDFDATQHEGYITLTTHNKKADEINLTALNALKEKSMVYKAEIQNDFPPHLYPIEHEMTLKVGAQIMFIKNDISFEKNFYNGKMGRVKSLSKDELVVFFPEENRSITVEKYEWNNVKFSLNETTGEIVEEILGTFVHYPIKLAWAITVHKSQGLTFDKAVLDVSQVFAPGQAYVALSRLRSLQGLVLLKPIALHGLQNDEQVVGYAQQRATIEQLNVHLDRATSHFVYQTLHQAFDWYDYTTKWATFELGFKDQGPKTEKGKDRPWVTAQLQSVRQVFDAARKFQQQISTLFSTEKIDWQHVHDRVQAAYNYFYPSLDAQVYRLVKRRMELARLKRTVQYSQELEELEVEVVDIVQKLIKMRLLVEAIVSGRTFTKACLKTPELTNYLIAKAAKVNQELRNSDPIYAMMDDEEEVLPIIQRGKAKKKAPKVPKEKKPSTYDITLMLFEDGKSIAEIARERQFSASTIEGHFAQLIRQEKIDITALMSQERIDEIEGYLENTEGKSLGTIKEELGDIVSYGELKFVQASKML